MTGFEVLIAAPLIYAVTQGLKITFNLENRWSFLTCLGVAFVFGVLYAAGTGAFTPVLAVQTLVSALTASGLYSGKKSFQEDDELLADMPSDL